MGYLDGIFIADEDSVKEVIGKEVYFGEVLGKHSEISGILEESDLEIIDLPDELVDILLEKLGSTISGYNPLSYYDEYSEEE